MKILVTGGAGYVGSHCLRTLLDAGHETVVLDNLSTGHRQSVDSRAEFVEGDLADDALLDGLFAAHRFEAVMHFAASLDVGESVRDPLKYYRNNVDGTLVLLEAMRRVDVTRLVFSSTCATFGVPDRLPITEDLPRSGVYTDHRHDGAPKSRTAPSSRPICQSRGGKNVRSPPKSCIAVTSSPRRRTPI